MTLDEMTYDNIKALALAAPFPKVDGRNRLKDAQWLAYGAKTPEMAHWYKLAKRKRWDLTVAGKMKPGDRVTMTIGPRRYVLIDSKKMCAFLRADFAEWCEANWHSVLTNDGKERESTKALHQADVRPISINQMYIRMKDDAKRMTEPTALVPDNSWDSNWDMADFLYRLHAELERDKKNGKFYIYTNMKEMFIAGCAEYKKRNYAVSAERFRDAAACAMKAAEWVLRNHCKVVDEDDNAADSPAPSIIDLPFGPGKEVAA